MQKGSSGVPEEVADVPAVLFADDDLLTAKTSLGLPALLDIATKWAMDNQMNWNTKAGKSEVLKSAETRNQQSVLSAKPLNKVSEANYLGVTLRDAGVTDTKTEAVSKKRKSLYTNCAHLD